jgi:hypothetical protein
MLDLCLVKFHSRTTSMYLDDLQVANHMGDEKGSDFPSHDISCVVLREVANGADEPIMLLGL